jgi:autotransporter-associated beta strand protein
MNAITRNPGAAINFTASGIATTDTLNDPSGILGIWATVGGDFATNSTNDADGPITAYGAYTDVMRLPGVSPETGVIADATTSNVRIVEGTGITPVDLTLGAATTNINTLTQSTVGGTSAATIALPSQTLRLGSAGGIVTSVGSGALTIGTSADEGVLTAGGDAIDLAGDIAIIANSTNPVTINSVIANNGTGAVSLTKTGVGTTAITGTNSFTGPLVVAGGTLSVSSIGNGGVASGVGQSPKAGSNLNINGGTLAYIGTTATTDRGFSIGTSGGTIEIPASTTLTFGSASAAFALGGTLTKTGAGTLSLVNYGGGTATAALDMVINDGVVNFGSGYFNASPLGYRALAITVNPNGILRASAAHALGGDNIDAGTSFGQIRLIGGEYNLLGSQYISGGTVSGEGRLLLQGGSVTGTSDFRANGGAGGAFITSLASATTSVIGNTGGISLQYGSLTVDTADGTALTDLRIAGPITSPAANTNTLTKTGAGLLELSGVNTYTGSTNVNAGTLELADNARLRFVIPATGASNKLTGAGTVTLKGDFAIDISAAAALTSGTWVLEDATTATYESTFSVMTPSGTLWTDAGGNKWTTPGVISGTIWTFDEATGTLSLALTAGYDSWKTQITNGKDARAEDADDDGFTNLQEFLFGTDPMASTGSLTSMERSGNDLIIRWRERTSGASYILQESETLANPWETSTAPITNDGAVVGDYEPVKATVPIGPGKDFFRVQGTELP